MEDIIIEDDMKKESNIFEYATIIFCVFGIFELLKSLFIDKNVGILEKVGMPICWFVFAFLFFCGYLYRNFYKVIVYKDKITKKSIFSYKEINISDITIIKYKRYNFSSIYIFKIEVSNNKMVFITRYKDRLVSFLNETNISCIDLQPNIVINNEKKMKLIKKMCSICKIIFGVAILSPVIGFIIIYCIGDLDIFGLLYGSIRYSWIMYFFIPLVIVFFIIESKIKQYNLLNKNYHGILKIWILLMIILGSIRFLNDNSYDVSIVYNVGETINIDMPERVKVITVCFETYNYTIVKIHNKDEQTMFENQIRYSQLWKNELETSMVNSLPIYNKDDIIDYDKFIYYNTITNEYNIYPKENDNSCILIAYKFENHSFIIMNDWKISL